MVKKGFNWKARRVVNTVIDNSDTQKIKVDINAGGHYDQSNELVLPSKKRKTKVKTEKVTRILSKKHRKRLEKIVEKKKKKQNRASLLENLQKVQATNAELSQLTSITAIQTKGLKRHFQEEANPKKIIPKRDLNISSGTVKLKIISGAKRRKLLEVNDNQLKNNDPNVVGFEKSDTETSDDSELEENGCEEEAQTVEDDIEDKINVGDQDSKKENDVVILEKEIEPVVVKDDTEISNVENKTIIPKTLPSKPAVFVDVIRNEEVQAARLKLPILGEEQQIMEAINENPVVIIAGETGSGKTTQVPQFLYEAGYALNRQIAVTEPRRVAAISMSERVAHEMNLSTREVSYLIRFEGNVTEDTKIKFMTDGVLLKEVQNDFFLTKYSVVILDEAHERSVHTDILIGCLSRIVTLRHKKGDPLKLIIMSATLRLEDFTLNQRLFKTPPPVLKVEARQFPVTAHFNKRTEEDYLKAAFNKAVKINTKLPEGGILIFVTGQQEVNSLVKKLRRTFPLRHKKKVLEREEQLRKDREGSDAFSDEDDLEEGLQMALHKKQKLHKKHKLKIIPDINLDDYSVPGDTEHASDEEISEDEDSDAEPTIITNAQPLWTLPLYSLLSTQKQQKVFKPPPQGCRLCVVSTNVAETSLTIPGIKYVIDTGKTKVKLYDKVTGVTRYVVHWISKAAADQRAGRAGRVSSGHCYRLYSSAVFNDVFQEYSVPEIKQKPVEDIYLQLKCMNIEKVVNFPFPTAPDLLQLKTAESRLETLGVLKNGKVTPLGRAVAKFPLLPKYGKMLALSHQENLLPYTICLVAALSIQEVLLEVPILQTSAEEKRQIRQRWSAIRQQWAGHGNYLLLGDNMVLLKAVGAAEYENSLGRLERFCNDNGLRQKAVVEIRKLRIQLTNEIRRNVPETEIVVDPKLEPPTDLQAKLLRQLLLSGMGDQIARKISLEDVKERQDKVKFKYAYQANNMEEPVFLHRGSVLKQVLPEYVVYQEIYETNKMYMRGVSAIEPEWLPAYVPSLCNLSEPLLTPEPRYDPTTGKVNCMVTGTFGRQAWPLPLVEIEYPKSTEAFKWFARFLLEGKVFARLERYVPRLLSPPNIMVKSWAKLQPRTVTLLKTLLGKECCSKTGLEDIWRQYPQYLLPAYLSWLPQSDHAEVSLLWPPLDRKVS